MVGREEEGLERSLVDAARWREELGRDVGLLNFYLLRSELHAMPKTRSCIFRQLEGEGDLEGGCPEAHGEETTGAGNSAERLAH